MPLTPGADVGSTIKELKTGKTYRHTKKKFGKKRARKQMIAIALKNLRDKRKRATKRGGRKMTRR